MKYVITSEQSDYFSTKGLIEYEGLIESSILQLVQNKAGSLASFASWLQGYLDALVPNDGIGVGLDTKAFLTIDAKLTDSFKHHGAGVPTSTPYTFTSPFMQTETSTVSYC